MIAILMHVACTYVSGRATMIRFLRIPLAEHAICTLTVVFAALADSVNCRGAGFLIPADRTEETKTRRHRCRRLSCSR